MTDTCGPAGLQLSFHYVSGSRYTFEDAPPREFAQRWMEGRVLNACAGPTELEHTDEVVRNDIDESVDAATHLDVHELPDEYGPRSFDTIVFDPPWSGFQAGDKYDGGDVNWTRELREGFDTMLRENGRVIQLGYTATNMPRDLCYEKVAVAVFCPYGRRKDFIGTVDVAHTTLLSFDGIGESHA